MALLMGVGEYFAGKSIFITGSTGFMGKVLIEKLLRCCPDIHRLYLLIRPKKGQSVDERLEDFLNCRVFDKLQTNSPQSFKKLHIITGDILAENLGISIMDRELLQRECQIIFHCAACVKFDMFIRDAVNMNTKGTHKVLQLAEGMKNLEAFIHTSTSYCHCELEVLEEKLYPSPQDPHKIMDMVDWMDDNTLTHLEQELIAPQPNTYAFTKSLTEDLVSQFASKFPIAIARPSIIICAYKEPMPGWVDNLNGPTGIIVGGGKGVLRTILCNEDHLADLIPVDMAVNGCILLAQVTGLERSKEMKICNITQSGFNPVTWAKALEIGRVHLRSYPFSVCLWYPDGSMKTSRLHHELATIFTQLLPAYFIDFLLYLCGQKPFMVRIQKRIKYGLKVLQCYTTKEWHFTNDNYRSLRTRISAKDDEVFYTDINMIDWGTYIKYYIKGIRKYCLKEDSSTIPQARRLHIRLYYLNLAVKILFTAGVIFFFYNYIFKLFIM